MSGEKSQTLNWDEYFILLASLTACRSKDPNTKVGAVIVDMNHRILSTGYNGFPNGCSDDDFPWDKTNNDVTKTKYPYVVHAELNAILNAKRDLSYTSMYVTHYPCENCTKAIIQSGIKTVYYLHYKNNSGMSIVSKKMFKAAGILVIQLESNRNTLNKALEGLFENYTAQKWRV